MKKRISWDMFHDACFKVSEDIKNKLGHVDVIVSIARGGVIPARIMDEYIHADRFLTIGVSSYHNNKCTGSIKEYQPLPVDSFKDPNDIIVIIDDISDKGLTFQHVYRDIASRSLHNVYTAAPYIKRNTKFVPNFWHEQFQDDEWVIFPYEIDK